VGVAAAPHALINIVIIISTVRVRKRFMQIFPYEFQFFAKLRSIENFDVVRGWHPPRVMILSCRRTVFCWESFRVGEYLFEQ
jgi:hypothetical protein